MQRKVERIRMALAFLIVFSAGCDLSASHDWSPGELRQLESLSLATLDALPPDPTNQYANDEGARRFGYRLFFETRMSANGAISCATCHQPQRRFTDGLAVSVAVGRTARNAPSLIGVAYSPWYYWDGRKDSLWAQALEPLEAPAEHGSHRLVVAALMYTDEYRIEYEQIFGELPQLPATLLAPFQPPENTPSVRWAQLERGDREKVNRIFSNVGKAIAAYERLLLPGESRFDRYVAALREGERERAQALLSAREVAGLRLFIGSAACTQCHNGPLFANNAFHNTGLLSMPGATPDVGRIRGVRALLGDEFNCLGQHSDAPDRCAELVFVKTGSELLGAMRTPSLRNVVGSEPYGHAGQFPDLASVLAHYDAAPDAMIGHNEAKPLNLWPWQLTQLEAFIRTLAAPPAVAEEWLRAPAPGKHPR